MRTTSILLLSILVLAPSGGLLAQELSLESLGLDGTIRGIEAAPSDWEEIAPGVQRLEAADGRILTLSRGADGLEWALAGLRERLEEIALVSRAQGGEKGLALLDTHLALMAEVERNLAAARERESADLRAKAAAPSCSGFKIVLEADAGTMECANVGTATTGYKTKDPDCPACSVGAYAYAQRTCGNAFWSSSDQCSNSATYNYTCSASAQRSDPFDFCYTYASAWVNCDEPIGYLQVQDMSNACGGPGCFPSC